MSGPSNFDATTCVSCGMILLSPKDAVLGMCTECLKNTREEAQTMIKGKSNRTGTVARKTLKFPAFMITDRAKRKK